MLFIFQIHKYKTVSFRYETVSFLLHSIFSEEKNEICLGGGYATKKRVKARKPENHTALSNFIFTMRL